MEQKLVVVLNILSLLKTKPCTFDELMKSGFFKDKRSLERGLHTLNCAGCIEKIKVAKIWVILGHGISLLSLYPNWTPLPVEVLDVVVPLRRCQTY